MQKKVATPLSKAKKQDITGPDDKAVKAKAQVVEEVKKEVGLHLLQSLHSYKHVYYCSSHFLQHHHPPSVGARVLAAPFCDTLGMMMRVNLGASLLNVSPLAHCNLQCSDLVPALQVPTEEPEEDEKAGAKRRSRRET